MSNQGRIALALIILCYISWGGGMVAMKMALQSFSAIHIMTARVICPALFYLFFFQKWKNERIRRNDIKLFILLAIFEPCLFFFCITNAMRFTSASEGSVIAACLPLFIAAGAYLFLKEKMTIRAICWLICAMSGIVGMNLSGETSFFAPFPLLGNLLMLLGMISSAGYTLIARKLSQVYSGLIISVFQAFIGCLIFVPLSFTQQWPQEIIWQAILAILWLGIWIGGVVYFTYNWSLGCVKAGIVGIMGNITPLTGLILAWIILGERLGTAQLGFAVIALVATAMAGLALMKEN